MWEQHDGDLTDQYVQDNLYFQHEEGEDDRWPLQALADALENSGDAAYQAADGIIEWDQFHRYWAASSVVMNFDAYPMRFAGDDCHVYYDVESERIHYFPLGVDESFYYDENFETRARGHIAAKCRSPTCRDAWANACTTCSRSPRTSTLLGTPTTFATRSRSTPRTTPSATTRCAMSGSSRST